MAYRTLADALAEICVLDAPLSRRLELFVEQQRAFGSPFVEATDVLVERLRARDYGRTAPQVGETMPEFILPDRNGRLCRLSDFSATGPVVLSFNRGHWCPFCRIELLALAEAQEDLLMAGARVVSILPDRQAFVGRLPEAVRRQIVLLSDIDNEYAGSMGLIMRIGAPLLKLMRAAGVDLAAVHGNSDGTVPLPATFVVGSEGKVLARFIDPEFRHRMEPGEIRKLIAEGRSRRRGMEPEQEDGLS